MNLKKKTLLAILKAKQEMLRKLVTNNQYRIEEGMPLHQLFHKSILKAKAFEETQFNDEPKKCTITGTDTRFKHDHLVKVMKFALGNLVVNVGGNRDSEKTIIDAKTDKLDAIKEILANACPTFEYEVEVSEYNINPFEDERYDDFIEANDITVEHPIPESVEELDNYMSKREKLMAQVEELDNNFVNQLNDMALNSLGGKYDETKKQQILDKIKGFVVESHEQWADVNQADRYRDEYLEVVEEFGSMDWYCPERMVEMIRHYMHNNIARKMSIYFKENPIQG
jgi:hypothetical protein